MSDMLEKLALLIEREQTHLLSHWRGLVRELPVAKNLDVPTLNDHIPHLLEELVLVLRSGAEESIAEALHDGSSPAHGLQRVKDAFDIEEIVCEYNILRGCIHDLADRNGLSLQGKPFHLLNRVLDNAIGAAVGAFAAQKALEVRNRREEYLAFVAHDLRTPLNAISLVSRVLEMLLARDVIDVTELTPMLNTLNRNVSHLDTLIRKIIEENVNLETELGVKLERRQFDLWPLVESLIHDLHPVAGTCSTRLVNAVPHDYEIYADASLLKRVFQNLIANAISYTPQGEVVIGAGNLDDGSTYQCFVQDNGEGMSEDRCQTVFDKHETDPNKVGGLGLGLAIVKLFVEAHDGAVTVNSQLGVGSTFTVTLPAASISVDGCSE